MGIEVQLRSVLTYALDGGHWSASRSGPFTPRGRTATEITPEDVWILELVCIVWGERKTSVPLVIRNQSVQPAALSCVVLKLQSDSFGTRSKKMRISQRLFIRF